MCFSNSNSGKSSKKVEEEEKLLKLFQGANKTQDGFMQWCEQMLHTLNTANNLDGEVLAPTCRNTQNCRCKCINDQFEKDLNLIAQSILGVVKCILSRCKYVHLIYFDIHNKSLRVQILVLHMLGPRARPLTLIFSDQL